MQRILFEDSAGITLIELGILLMLDRSDRTSLLEMARQFSVHWRCDVEPEVLLISFRRMIERSWIEPHPGESDRTLLTDLGKVFCYQSFLGFVHLVDPTGTYFKASVVCGLTTRPPGADDDD